MAERWIFIEPNDVLMFRDSRPFAAGVNFTARSMFPPHPRTMQGVIRSHILEAQGADLYAYDSGRGDPVLVQALGQPDSWGTLKLSGPFVAKMTDKNTTERYFRAPFDLLQSRTTPATVTMLHVDGSAAFQTNAPFEGWRPLLPGDTVAGGEADGWLGESAFSSYLDGTPPTALVDNEELYMIEPRVGLGLDRQRRRHEEGLFYHAEFVRPQRGVGLLVGVEGDNDLLPDNGAICIGGEGRAAHYKTLARYAPTRLQAATTGQIRVVLLTPAYFSGGWQPEDGNWSPWVGAGGRLVSLAIGKPQIISGWNLAAANGKGAPRPIRHFVPAGSVFCFENATWQGRPFSEDDDAALGAMGFGAAALGVWR